MYSKIIDIIKDKSLVLVGFGKEGKSSYNFIRKYLPNKEITIVDKNDKLFEQNDFLNNDNNIKVIMGDNYLDSLNDYDLIIKSPGVKIPDNINDLVKNKITSQLELILEVDRNNEPELEEGTYYIVDLIGLEVYTDEKVLLGIVEDIFNTGSNDIYVVKDVEGKEILLPGIDDVIKDVDENLDIQMLGAIAKSAYEKYAKNIGKPNRLQSIFTNEFKKKFDFNYNKNRTIENIEFIEIKIIDIKKDKYLEFKAYYIVKCNDYIKEENKDKIVYNKIIFSLINIDDLWLIKDIED